MRKRNRQKKKQWRQRLVLCLAVATTLCTLAVVGIVVPHVGNLMAFRREQAMLPNYSPFDDVWREINPDYVGWIRINGTTVDYPVVRGRDNVQYLTMSFSGEENILGAIFMDYRLELDTPNLVIYGHQARDEAGTRLMFGGLFYFRDNDAELLENYSTIEFMENGMLHKFEIFSARQTDIFDPGYQIRFETPLAFELFLRRIGAPYDTTQVITLSTCIGHNNDRRFIVQGALVSSTEVH
ncbi:MAG: class B sortase [Defluviitaleaceae bacterium]|nr:class B sortase [Defluviitaleaceae bacterium]MCL2262115.1 class B sortase [Defluviitaleaceae bacterium]